VFNCSGLEDGQYPDPSKNCSQIFYDCINGTAIEFACPLNLHYHSEMNECLPPETVPGCVNGTPGLSLNCTNLSNGIYPSPHNDCSTYFFICSNGLSHFFQCPENLYYDPETFRCNVYNNITACISNETTTPAVPGNSFDCTGLEDGPYPNPMMFCSNSYFECTDELTTVKYCAEDEAFDPETELCENIENVAECNDNEETTIAPGNETTIAGENVTSPTTDNVTETTENVTSTEAGENVTMSTVGNATTEEGENITMSTELSTSTETAENTTTETTETGENVTMSTEENATTEAGENVTMSTEENATTEAGENVTMSTEENATTEAGENITMSTEENATTEVGENVTMSTEENATTEAGENVTMSTEENATTEAGENVTMSTAGNATTEAAENVTSASGSTTRQSGRNVTASPVRFNCSGRSDKDYPNPRNNCSTVFYTCSNGVAFERRCSAGTYYDPSLGVCESRKNIEACSRSRRTTQAATTVGFRTTEFDCSYRDDGNYPAGDCMPYYFACVGGHPFRQPCPADTYYDNEMNQCNFRFYVPNCGGIRTTTIYPSTTVAIPIRIDCTDKPDGNYGDPNEPCTNYYYVCYSGSTAAFYCPPGLVYDDSNQRCEFRRYTVACGGRPRSDVEEESASGRRARRRSTTTEMTTVPPTTTESAAPSDQKSFWRQLRNRKLRQYRRMGRLYKA
ncbi:unnamed protein product, partial [Soboliphyme baturini]|uniref:Chitin-binding type-2 domain-containing protein n=1 Tax=Soboliphyme baturini TaxID=241478 RepID=A0A183J579_9BILA